MQCYNWFMAAALQRIEEEQFCVFRGICIFQFLKLSLCRMNEHILFRYSSLIISKLARWAKNLKSPLQSRTHRGNILCINMLHWTCSFIWTQVNFLNLLCWMCLDEGMMKVQPVSVEALPILQSWVSVLGGAGCSSSKTALARMYSLYTASCSYTTAGYSYTTAGYSFPVCLTTGTTIICRVLLPV